MLMIMYEEYVCNLLKCMLMMVYEDSDSPYDDLLSKCHMTTQECQRTRTLDTEVYKPANGMAPSYIQGLFYIKEIPYNFRGPSRTIVPKVNSTTYGLKSLRHEGNKVWNRLPVDIKNIRQPGYI